LRCDAVLQISSEFDESLRGREELAVKVEKKAKEVIESLRRCKDRPLFSQYDVVSQYVFPAMIRRHGRRVQVSLID